MYSVSTPQIFLLWKLEMNWKDWPQQLEDKNHSFLAGKPSTTSFAITYGGVVTLRRDILVVVLPLMTHRFYCGQDCTQECAQGCERWRLPLGVLAWETFWENYSGPTQVASEKRANLSNKGRGGKELEINLGCRSGSTPGAFPPHLGGKTGRDK